MKVTVRWECPECQRPNTVVNDTRFGFSTIAADTKLECECGVRSGLVASGGEEVKTNVDITFRPSECSFCGKEFKDDERVLLHNAEDPRKPHPVGTCCANRGERWRPRFF